MEQRTTTRGRRARPGKHSRRRRRSRLPLAALALALAVGVSACALMGGREEEKGTNWSQLTAAQPVETPDAPDVPETPAEPEGEPLTPLEPAEPVEPQLPEEPQEPTEDWMLLLVNPWTYLPEDYSVTLKELRNNQSVDERCYPDLQEMMDACRADGLQPLICSSFRTWEKQEKLYKNKIQRLIDAGMDPDLAPEEAGKVVAVPGTSEHQLGLAVDIVDVEYQVLDEAQEDTAVQKWLMEHSWEYGFILRYPNDKSDVTGIIYEPWHYRYVGREAAKEIYEQDVTLEEYLQGRAA